MKQLFSWVRSEFLFWTGFVCICLGNILFIGLIFSKRLPAPISAIGERKYATIPELMRSIISCYVLVSLIIIVILFIARRRMFIQFLFSFLSTLWMLYIAAIGYIVLSTPEGSFAWTPQEITPWPETDSTLALYEFGSLVLYFSLLLNLLWRGTTFTKIFCATPLVFLQFIIVYFYIGFD